VTISYTPLGKENMNDFENGWSLSFNVGIGGGAVDYSNSEWQVIDNKTQKRYGEGPLKDAVEAATESSSKPDAPQPRDDEVKSMCPDGKDKQCALFAGRLYLGPTTIA
jgi:hypothetical protein